MEEHTVELSDLQLFYVGLWDEREENGYIRCFETGERMSRGKYRMNWSVYSHILPKSKYPQYKFSKWNVKIVTPNAHTQFETFAEKAPKQYELSKKLLILHKKGDLK